MLENLLFNSQPGRARTKEGVAPLYGEITRTAIHAVKAEQVATFLGKKLHGNNEAEVGTHFHTRIEGTCIQHHATGKAAIKLYDKFGRVLRIETTFNDVGFFRHYRELEHRDGTSSRHRSGKRSIRCRTSPNGDMPLIAAI